MTSSNRVRAPKRMVTLLTEITAGGVLEKVNLQFSSGVGGGAGPPQECRPFGILDVVMAYRLKRSEAVGDGARRVAQEELGAAIKIWPCRRSSATPVFTRPARVSRKFARCCGCWAGDGGGGEPGGTASAQRGAEDFGISRCRGGDRNARPGSARQPRREGIGPAAPDAGIQAFRESLLQMKLASEQAGVGKALRLASAAMEKAEGACEVVADSGGRRCGDPPGAGKNVSARAQSPQGSAWGASRVLRGIRCGSA